VIEHYRTLGDTLKLRAAEFLIAHMTDADKFSYSGKLIEQYDTLFRFQQRLFREGTLSTAHDRLDSLWKVLKEQYGPLDKRRLTLVPDTAVITAQMLIDNIDHAVDAAWRHSSLYSPLKFFLFSEYVLPYRVQNEQVEPFRERYRQEYAALLDSAETLQELVTRLTRKQRDEGYETLRFMWNYPIDIPISKLDMGRRGSCDHIAIWTALILRACGYPATIDQAVWGDRSSGHTWNVVMNPTGEEFPFDVVRDSLEQNYRPAKVWRTAFSGDIDVTEKYARVYDLALPVNASLDGNSHAERQAALCTFDNKQWRPVAQGTVVNDTLRVARVAANLVYLPAYIEGGKPVPCGAPFILHTDGRMTVLQADSNRKQQMTLTRKYPRFNAHRKYAMNITGSRVEASHEPDFRHRLTLAAIHRAPETGITSVGINTSERYRYLRMWCAPEKKAHFAEIAFYGRKTPDSPEQRLTGTIIGFPKKSGRPYSNAMDGDLDSFFQKEEDETGWVGLDLGEENEYYVTRVEYSPRSGTNYIMRGNRYELVYWDEYGWRSMSSKIARRYDRLDYDGVPSGGLYLLHNLDGGTEERIFTYEAGKQVWW
jgi:hypothetical protein